MKYKVLFFSQVGNGGGAEKMTAKIASMLDRESYDIKFYAVSRFFKKGICPTPDGIYLHVLKNIHITFFSTIRFIWLLKKEKPDFVFCSLQYINWRLILASKEVGGIKVIVRNENTFALNRWYDKIAIRLVYRHADTVIAQQEEMRQEIISVTGISPSKVITLHNPVDFAMIKRMSSEPCITLEGQTNYITAGRISPTKGIDVLLKAFCIVWTANEKAHLYILGRYSETNKYYLDMQKYIKDNSLNEHVHFVGFQENPYKWIVRADCFVLASRIEGLPNVLIEALTLGKPVAATKSIPAISRIIDSGNNGFVVAVDDEEELARAMQKAVNLKDVRLTYKLANKEDFIELFKKA